MEHVGPRGGIEVTPPAATITADDTIQFAATGSDGRGNEVPTSPSWAATCGTVNATGFYVPRTVGACTVDANASGVSGSAEVTVLAGALARVTIAPTNATITADETLRFAATGYDATGNAVPITPTWRAEEGAIDAAGLYAPSFAGVWRVWA